MIPLENVRRKGLLDYDIVASSYVNEFHKKWIGKNHSKSELLGNPDFQSLSDLSNSFNVASDMRLVPYSYKSFIQLLFLISMPFFPLILTIIPLKDMIDRVIKMLFY